MLPTSTPTYRPSLGRLLTVISLCPPHGSVISDSLDPAPYSIISACTTICSARWATELANPLTLDGVQVNDSHCHAAASPGPGPVA
ncbi:hypothetical protein PLICRDRAFT_338334 [Plicaturopsis crispa FD-325 SS-3]|uniref:Unplaced genomic scaffold PLICRscaffold_15, whole genome shotgun sequence n=1 Tax=Plicaturopsis crispa FD-325 SS-3 TaxID=944288 RepID=A0A0C9SYW1_PLICR|nr:hypothetical protein PLICRDRAFT_338334 [Plicaturopsis crispa FD-325 SS-3]